MKLKYLYIISLIFIISQNYSFSTQTKTISWVNEIWESTRWKISSRDLMTYSDNTLYSLLHSNLGVNYNWEDVYRIFYQNADTNSNKYAEIFIDNIWKPSWNMISIKTDTSLITKISFSDNSNDNQIYIVNFANNRIQSEIYQQEIDSDLINIQRKTYNYIDSQPFLLKSIVISCFNQILQSWLAVDIFNYTYFNSDSLLLISISENFKSPDTAFNHYYYNYFDSLKRRIATVCNDQKGITKDGSDSVNFSYNSDNSIADSTCFKFSNNKWLKQSRQLFHYQNSELNELISQLWVANSWQNYMRYRYFDSTLTNVETQPLRQDSFSFYQNEIYLQSEDNINEIQIYDYLGNEIYSFQAIDRTLSNLWINLRQVPVGLYFLKYRVAGKFEFKHFYKY